MKEALAFDDVLLVPQYSEIYSRNEINTFVEMGNDIRVEVPIVSAPMDTVVNVETASALMKNGALPIVHRYNTIEEQCSIIRRAIEGSPSRSAMGAAIGVNDDFIDRACALRNAGAKIICIDVAHGHHVKVRYALETLRHTFGNTVHIMAGNVATLEGFNALADWGAHSIRCGIGGGSICSTRIQTGHGQPTFQTILDVARSDRDALIIADGGIKTSGDIVKALAAGADLVMVGSLLAGTEEAPGAKIGIDGKLYKSYRGMASKAAQNDWRGKVSSIEGVAAMVPCKGRVEDVLRELRTGICSGLSYSGATSISELQMKAHFIRQTTAGQIESSTHIKRRC